jgi:cytosine/adenosine deaminase-related metal-dependent hydrolase
MVHVAETTEEQRFLRRGDGEFRELLENLGRLPDGFRPPGLGAVTWLDRLGILGPRTALVHCQHLEAGDPARIRARGATIVVCPGTIRYFRRHPPDVVRWLDMGIPVALGTDSRASNVGLSMPAEISLARRFWPQLSPRTVLAMATGYGARALARPGIGSLRLGRSADCVAMATNGCRSADEVLERFTSGSLEVATTFLGGRAVESGPRRP